MSMTHTTWEHGNELVRRHSLLPSLRFSLFALSAIMAGAVLAFVT